MVVTYCTYLCSRNKEIWLKNLTQDFNASVIQWTLNFFRLPVWSSSSCRLKWKNQPMSFPRPCIWQPWEEFRGFHRIDKDRPTKIVESSCRVDSVITPENAQWVTPSIVGDIFGCVYNLCWIFFAYLINNISYKYNPCV